MAHPSRGREKLHACADEIRIRARTAIQEYLALEEYRYVQAVLPKLTPKQKKETQALEVSGKVMGLADALAEDNLVVLREYGTPGMFSEIIAETAKKLRGLSFKALPASETEQEEIQEDWQVEGQMSISDMVVV